MTEIFDGSDSERLEVVLGLRHAIYANSGRDPAYADAWRTDDYDRECLHVLMRDDHGEPAAAVRIAYQGWWPLERVYRGELDKKAGVEFGRLGIRRPEIDGHRTLFSLIHAACRHCERLGRNTVYAMAIAPFVRAMQRMALPMEILSSPIEAYGERQRVLRYDVNNLLRFYDNAGSKLRSER